MAVAVAVAAKIAMMHITARTVMAAKETVVQIIVQEIIIIITGPAPTNFVWAPHLYIAQTAVMKMVAYDYINNDL
jgi:hypothetical protein|tara:strand:+ start:421 stop:645 length:225 start_codon:yes stop_codon:yes gene_type:complete